MGSQRTVEFPKVEQKNDYSTEIVSVTLTKSQLVIKMSVVKTPDFDWISIDRNTIVVAGGKKYKIKDTDGIAFSPGQSWLSYDSEKRYFTLYFSSNSLPILLSKAEFFIGLMESVVTK